MAVYVASETVGGVPDQRARSSAAVFARPHSIAKGWTTLRVGCRMIMDGTGASIYGCMRMGLCSGADKTPVDAGCTNSVYVVLGHPSLSSTYVWTYTAGPPERYAVLLYAGSTVNAVETIGQITTSSSPRTHVVLTGNATANRALLFMDFKWIAATTIRIGGVFFRNRTADADPSSGDFLAQLSATAPAFTSHEWMGLGGTSLDGRDFTIDEGANGSLDSFFVSWQLVSPTIDFCDIGIVRLA